MAQGHGRSQAAGSPGAAHSNAPAGIPAASRDRDHGKQRAQDVGRGKKKGLTKQKHHKSFKERLGFKKHNKTQAKNHTQHRSQGRGRN